MRKMALCFAVVIGVQSSWAAAESPKVASDGNKIVCQLAKEAHSRIPSRVCRTKAQWDAIAKANEDDMRSAGEGYASGRSGTIIDDRQGAIISTARPSWPK